MDLKAEHDSLQRQLAQANGQVEHWTATKYRIEGALAVVTALLNEKSTAPPLVWFSTLTLEAAPEIERGVSEYAH